MADNNSYLSWGIVCLVIGIILLIVVILVQTQVIVGTEDRPLEYNAWYWVLLDIIAIILIIIGVVLLCRSPAIRSYGSGPWGAVSKGKSSFTTPTLEQIKK